jgi:hypothetical protein
MIGFAVAALRLHLAALDAGGDGKLSNIEVVLCEDCRTVMIYAISNGNTLAVSFALDALTTEDAFDASKYVGALQP